MPVWNAGTNTTQAIMQVPDATIGGLELTAIIALVGLIATLLYNIFRIYENIKQARARTLIDLMRAWDSSYLDAGKNTFYPMIEEAIGSTVFPNAQSTPRAQKAGISSLLDVKLDEMKRDARALQDNSPKYDVEQQVIDKYIGLLRLADFFQNIGILVKRGYVSKSDALALYGGHVRTFDCLMRTHLSKMNDHQRNQWKEVGFLERHPPGGWFYEPYFYFADLAEANQQHKQ